MHTEVRWLSLGRMLTRLFSMREGLQIFLFDLAKFLVDQKWLAQLSYLADIFSETNKINKAMQGANTNSIIQYERVEAFKRQLKLWKTCVSLGITV